MDQIWQQHSSSQTKSDLLLRLNNSLSVYSQYLTINHPNYKCGSQTSSAEFASQIERISQLQNDFSLTGVEGPTDQTAD